jgi:hypothetical protein
VPSVGFDYANYLGALPRHQGEDILSLKGTLSGTRFQKEDMAADGAFGSPRGAALERSNPHER